MVRGRVLNPASLTGGLDTHGRWDAGGRCCPGRGWGGGKYHPTPNLLSASMSTSQLGQREDPQTLPFPNAF